MLTGATYLSDIRGVGIKEVELEHFGFAKKVVVSRKETVIIGGDVNQKKLEDFVNDLKMNLAQCKTEEERYPIEKRIARLTGGVAVIQVGAATETELTEKLDRFDDAVRATKAAISEGYVAGGGVTFMAISERLHSLAPSNDFEKGKNLLLKALYKPFFQMMGNVGWEANDKLKDIVVANEHNKNMGFNTRTGEVVDLIEAGIIDSTKALRCALQNAASIAGMLLTSECLIEANH